MEFSDYDDLLELFVIHRLALRLYELEHLVSPLLCFWRWYIRKPKEERLRFFVVHLVVPGGT